MITAAGLGPVERSLVLDDHVPSGAVVGFQREPIRQRIEIDVRESIPAPQQRDQVILADLRRHPIPHAQFVHQLTLQRGCVKNLQPLDFFVECPGILQIQRFTRPKPVPVRHGLSVLVRSQMLVVQINGLIRPRRQPLNVSLVFPAQGAGHGAHLAQYRQALDPFRIRFV